MRQTKELTQLQQLHTLYKKCWIVPKTTLCSHNYYTVGVCKTCGMAFYRVTRHGFGLKGPWLPLSRKGAANFIRQIKSVNRRKKTITHAEIGPAKVKAAVHILMNARKYQLPPTK